jgi:hypothetical protein
MTNEVFLAQVRTWIAELRSVAQTRPATGACALASALELWLAALQHLQQSKDAHGDKLFHGTRQGVTFALADALAWLVAARYLLVDVLELGAKGVENPTVAEGLDGLLVLYEGLCATQAARAAGEAGRLCSEVVYGYGAAASCCQANSALASFETLRTKVDRALAGLRLTKDRAAETLTTVMIPEALDYPV